MGGRNLLLLRWDGELLPRWPRRGRRPFASSPAFGDIDGDGRGEIVIGCDDGRVCAFHVDGDQVEGWPVRTGRDVFSTPALADLNSDGIPEVIVGSDDGHVYAFLGSGALLWRARLPGGSFVSASPTVADIDVDGNPEVVVGGWDGRIHVFTSDGRPLASPSAGDSIIWSSATAFEVRGQGVHLAWSSNGLHIHPGLDQNAGSWRTLTESWMVSSPAIVEFRPRHVGIVVGSERLYAWSPTGESLPGWPVDLHGFIWSSPVSFDLDGDGEREIVVGSWDGGVYALKADGGICPGFPLRTEGPIFSTPAASPLPEGGGLLAVASWDGTVRGWRLPRARFGEGDWLQFRGSPRRTGYHPSSIRLRPSAVRPSQTPPRLAEVTATRNEPWFGGVERLIVEGEALNSAESATLHYRLAGEEGIHTVPIVNSGGTHVALIQPLRFPHRVSYWVELRAAGEVQRWPHKGSLPLIPLRSTWAHAVDRISIILQRVSPRLESGLS